MSSSQLPNLTPSFFGRARAKKHQPDPWVNPHGSQVGRTAQGSKGEALGLS